MLEGLGGNISATRQHRSLQARHRDVVIFDELLVPRAEITDKIALRERDGIRGATSIRCAAPIGPQRCHWQDDCQESKDMHFDEQKGVYV